MDQPALRIPALAGHRANPFWAMVSRKIAAAGLGCDLQFKDHKGRLVAGEQGAFLPRMVVSTSDPLLPLRMLLSPALAIGESYMDGRLEFEKGRLCDLIELGLAVMRRQPHRHVSSLGTKKFFVPSRRNMLRQTAHNVRHHYDLPTEFYSLWLDKRMQYSCAYFPEGTETLAEAQALKIAHIAAKLALEPGQSVLDIGCGWGGLAIELAEQANVSSTGITLALEQHAEASRRAEESPARARIQFHLADYRQWECQHDRIVSVGMLEHVGKAGLADYFRHLARLLRPRGVALVHAIGCWDARSGSNAWLDRYIFPGGFIPGLSQVIAGVEQSGLKLLDMEILRLHYALTLAHWSARFQAQRDTAREMFGERFCRMWEFYLAACEAGFRSGELMVFQLLLGHERDVVPITRDYIAAEEAIWRERLLRDRP